MRQHGWAGIQFGAGGSTPVSELQNETVRAARSAIDQMKRLLDAGCEMIMVESEGYHGKHEDLTKRYKLPASSLAFGLEYLMFEAADPEVFTWYVTTNATRQSLRESQPDRPTGMPSLWDLGGQRAAHGHLSDFG